MGVDTSALAMEAYMFVLGFGLGMVMQVLIIVVQNVVPYRDLGAATSGVTFFRSIGGSFGVATFGAIFSNVLTANIARYLPASAGPSTTSLAAMQSNPMQLHQLPPAIHAGYIHAYASALQPVFLVAGCVGVAAFLLAWLIPEVTLKQTVLASDTGDTYAMPSERTSVQELERALSVLAHRENRFLGYQRLAAAAEVDIDPFACWMLIQLGCIDPIAVSQLAQRLDTSIQRLQPALDDLQGNGYIACVDETVCLTTLGDGAYARLVKARSKGLEKLLRGWAPEQQAEMADTVRTLAEKFLSEDFDDLLAASKAAVQAASRSG